MKKIIGLSLVFFLIIQGVLAQDIISAKELAKIYKKTDVTIISCRKAESYAKMHITGSVNLDLKKLCKPGKLKGILLPTDEIASILGKKGISNKNTLVIYDKGNYKYAGRLYWILKYLGCENVKVLDGHLQGWQKARKPVTKTATKAKAVTFTVNEKRAFLATTRDVKVAKSNANVILIDARSREEFSGEKGKTPKLGHIPSAKSFEYKKVLNTSGQNLKSKADLQAIFTKAGITSDKEIILYCETSVRAGVVFLALKGLGYSKVKVYDGAFWKWTSMGSNQVEK